MSALKAAREDPPDLAICDPSMPGMDGFSVSSILKRTKTFKAPVLILSGRVSEKDIQTALRTGADAFIAKPVERDKLLSTVAQWLTEGEHQPAEYTPEPKP
jgi:CheY-like chemotaxis protein